MAELWKSLSKGLKAYGCQLIAVEENLVDLIWNDRPDLPSSPLLFLPIELSGYFSLSYNSCALLLRHVYIYIYISLCFLLYIF